MIRVLVADDHAIVREGLKRILGDESDLVLAGEATNGHEVLAAVRAGGFDILLLDLSMPGKSAASVSHMRMLDEPRRQTPPGRGGDSRSAAAKAASSFAHRPPVGASMVAAGGAAASGCRFESGRAKTRFQSPAIRTTCQP